MPMRGISRFFIETLLSHSTEKLRRGTLLCFTEFPVSKKFFEKRWGEEGEEGGVSRFSVEKFCLTVPKFFVGEPLSISLISGMKKFYAYEGNITIF